jgi:hypothetical protein
MALATFSGSLILFVLLGTHLFARSLKGCEGPPSQR